MEPTLDQQFSLMTKFYLENKLIWFEILSFTNSFDLFQIRRTSKQLNKLTIEYLKFYCLMFDHFCSDNKRIFDSLNNTELSKLKSMVSLQKSFKIINDQIENNFSLRSFFVIRTFEIPPKILADLMASIVEIIFPLNENVTWNLVRKLIANPQYFINKLFSVEIDTIPKKKILKIKNIFKDIQQRQKNKIIDELGENMIELFFNWILVILEYCEIAQTLDDNSIKLKDLIILQEDRFLKIKQIKRFLSNTSIQNNSF